MLRDLRLLSPQGPEIEGDHSAHGAQFELSSDCR
jgi:hypothetical protein